MADGGYVFSLSFIMKDGSAESIHAYSGTTYVPKGYEGRGVSFHIDKFHSYTQEEMRRYYCFSEYGLFGYSMDDAITLEKVIDGSRIEIGSYLPTEELLALLESTKMQMLDIHEAEGEVLYSIENKTGFDIHIFSDTMIGFLIYPKDNFYYLYEITEGASMDEIIALLLSLAEQP